MSKFAFLKGNDIFFSFFDKTIVKDLHNFTYLFIPPSNSTPFVYRGRSENGFLLHARGKRGKEEDAIFQETKVRKYYITATQWKHLQKRQNSTCREKNNSTVGLSQKEPK